MKSFTILLLNSLIVVFLFNLNTVQGQADGESKVLLKKMINVTGNYDKLRAKKDVEFHYVYDNFDAGRDVSTERLIFDGEQSWASYSEHKRNVLPTQDGLAQQSLIDGVPQLTLNGSFITDKEAIGATIFIREVNPYWFTMLYKLEDKGTNYSYIGKEEIDGVNYDKVSLTYDNTITGKEADDAYILYFNPETHLIDLFYFSLPAFGVNEPILKMTLGYDVIEGIYIPTQRKSYGPTPTGEYVLSGSYTFSNIKFNNGFKKKDFILKGK